MRDRDIFDLLRSEGYDIDAVVAILKATCRARKKAKEKGWKMRIIWRPESGIARAEKCGKRSHGGVHLANVNH